MTVTFQVGYDLLDIDLESGSSADLKKCGTYNYANPKHTQIWVMSYRFRHLSGEYTEMRRWLPGQPCPPAIANHVAHGRPIWGHNVEFEREMWEAILVPQHGFPPVQLEQWHCTMADGNASGFPASLDNLGAAVGIEHRKDMGGYQVMMKLAKPRDWDGPNGAPRFWTPDVAPEDHARLRDYCDTDVVAQGEVRERLYRLSAWERRVYLADARINRRGVGVDRKAVAAALRIVELESDRLNAKLAAVTGGAVTKLTQRDRLKKWLASQGVNLDNLTKQTVKNALEERVFELPEIEEDEEDDDLDLQEVFKIQGVARQALEIRREGAKSSTGKLISFLLQCCPDGRVRGLFVYSKAHTRRWASKGVQLQNFPRGVLHLKPHEIEHAIQIMVESKTPAEAAALLRLNYGAPLYVISDCLRSFLVAAPGHEFVATDASQIEARMLAFLSGDQDTLDAFARGEEIYRYEASRLFGRKITKADTDERQNGKVASLAFQYGGGVGAGHQMGNSYGVYKEDAEWERLRDLYRQTHPHQVSYWRKLEDAARNAILNPGQVYTAAAHGVPSRACIFKVVGSNLLCKMPSGGVIVYPYPRVMPLKTPWGQIKDTVTYMGVHPKIKKWVRLKTHGGKLSENVTQAISRDVQAAKMLAFEERGWPVVTHSHDELVAETLIGTLKLGDANAVMAEPLEWTAGCPLGAAGWVGPRYRKE